MNLENEILQLCFDVLEKEMTPLQAQKEILRLFDVVGQSEQLVCGANKWGCPFYQRGKCMDKVDKCKHQVAK